LYIRVLSKVKFLYYCTVYEQVVVFVQLKKVDKVGTLSPFIFKWKGVIIKLFIFKV
jgi:hypothetical protein